MTRWLRHPLTGPVAATIVVALLVLATTDRFLAVGNLNNLALQVSIVALVAIGSTIVIIVGGIDLSPGSMIALLTMLLASMLKFWGVEFWPAIVLTLVAGAVLGSVNGFVMRPHRSSLDRIRLNRGLRSLLGRAPGMGSGD